MKRIGYILLIGTAFINVKAVKANYPGNWNKILQLPGDSIKKDSAKAAADTADDDDEDRLFAFGVEYASDQEHYGLHNDVKLPYLQPNFTYTAPKGFYIELSDQYILVKKFSGFDAFCVNPGWDIDFGDNTTWNINYTHYTFSSNSANFIKSSLANSLETYVTQWIGHLKGKFTIDYDIYKNKSSPNDLVFTPDLTYKFKWKLGKKTALKVLPEASIDFGTRNFYTQYLVAKQQDSVSRKLLKKEKNINSNSNSSFGALDYNLILNIDFVVGKFDFEPGFTYTDPLYQSSSVPNPPTGYMTLAITYTISSK